MSHREMCLHMATTHRVTLDIMALDPTPGIRTVFARLFPGEQFKAEEKIAEEQPLVPRIIKTEEDKIPAGAVRFSGTELNAEDTTNTREPAHKSKPIRLRSLKELMAENDGENEKIKSMEISPASAQPKRKADQFQNKRGRRPGSKTKLSENKAPTVMPSKSTSTTSKIDGPLEELVTEEKNTKSKYLKPNAPEKTKVFEYKFNLDAVNQDLGLPQKLEGPHCCKNCNGTGKNSKNLRLESVADLKQHYLQCYYGTGHLYDLVDPGDLNRDDNNGNPKDDKGKQFKYKCPFPTCGRNTGRGAGRFQFSYGDYATHLGREHGLLEVLLSREKREGVAGVKAALYRDRLRNGVEITQIPPVDYEEIHKCRLCKSKEGEKLSFGSTQKLRSLLHHYATCFYDNDKYSIMFPLEKENQDSKGRPMDATGDEFAYYCEDGECSTKARTPRNAMGYKAICIHQAVEHGGLDQLLRNSGDPSLLDLLDKIAFYSEKLGTEK